MPYRFELEHNKTVYEEDCQIIMNTTEFVQFNYKSKGFGYKELYGGEHYIQVVKGGKNVSYNE